MILDIKPMLRRLVPPCMTGPELEKLSETTFAELQMRVGQSIADRLTQTEIEEYRLMFETSGKDLQLTWLNTHVPEHPRIVEQQADEMMTELRYAIRAWHVRGSRRR